MPVLGLKWGSWLHRDLISAGMVVEHERLSAARAALRQAEQQAKHIVAAALANYQERLAAFNALEAEWNELNPPIAEVKV